MKESKTNLNYRSLYDELQVILQEMQREDLDVDEALKNYEEGLVILKKLEDYLRTAENKVIELKAKFGDA